VLEHAGLVTQGREAQWRPRRLAPAPLREVADYLEQYRRFWEASLDRLDDYLRILQRDPPQEPPHDHKPPAARPRRPPRR
jgi:hypothetical protein